jgi:hypothetical protein
MLPEPKMSEGAVLKMNGDMGGSQDGHFAPEIALGLPRQQPASSRPLGEWSSR